MQMTASDSSSPESPNQKQQHLLVIDPLESLNLKLDSSLRMGFELARLGCDVFTTESRYLSWDIRQTSARCLARKLVYKENSPAAISFDSPRSILLDAFAGIHMRKEPPFNIDYITSTWLLDSAKSKSWIFNAPGALRNINEKLSIFLFPHSAKNALLSSDALELLDFVKNQANGDAIVKPLDLFGGRGIFRIKLGIEEDPGILRQLQEATKMSTVPRLIQPFDERIHEGEIRVFTVGGKAISWCLKKPESGNFMANTSQGATLEKYTPSKELSDKIEAVAQELVNAGIFLAGFDVIGDAISEINVTSPRLLQAQDDQTNYYEVFARWVAEKCSIRPR